MILPVLVAAALAGAPAVEAAPAPAPIETDVQDRLDVPIALQLKDASVVDVLEKFADLLQVTPILDPGVGGRFSVEISNVPLRKALEMIGQAANVDVTVSSKVLRVRAKAGSKATGAATVPATPAPDPAPLGGALRFWLDGTGEPPVTVRVPDFVGRVELPGCAGPVTLGRLGTRAGATVGVAIATAGSRGVGAKGRILGESAASGTKVLLSGCDGRLVVEVGDPLPGVAVTEPVRVPNGENLVLTLRLLELTEKSEESLTEPRIAFRSDSGFSTKSGFEAGPRDAFGQVAEIHGLPLEFRAEDESLLLAVWAGVTRTPAGGGPVLVARRAETFRLQKGKPLRWTVDSSWDGGRAAIVLELTLARIGAAPR
ncbi:MAG: hypothetical protein ACYDBY_15560 [Thermoanaerobaculia bacterium]